MEASFREIRHDCSYLDYLSLEKHHLTAVKDHYSVQEATPFFLLTKAPVQNRSLESDIQEVFEQVSKIESASPYEEYSFSVGGQIETGMRDDFLRRRTADEIIESGFSTGCGDYAIAFYQFMQNKGYTVQFVDSVQISYRGVLTAYAGHTGVLVFDKTQNRWLFVDPTAQTIVSQNWDLSEPYYKPNGENGTQYWIGYHGSLEDYPAKNSEDLKRFYQEILDKVPKKVWKRELIGLEFVIDNSFVEENGHYANPNVTRFVEYPQEALSRLGIKPKKRVKIRITKGGEDDTGDLTYTEKNGWILSVGTEAAMSFRLLDYVEMKVRKILSQK